jgi:NADP-dependent 3-hydroxy acid dehydrogenase YdfG
MQIWELFDTAALVTGASSGIGAATARALAAQGTAVCLLGRRKDRLEDVATMIREKGGKAIVAAGDVCSAVDVDNAIGKTINEFGHLDILVNCAGLMLLGPVSDLHDEASQRMIDVNQIGLFHCTRTALPHLILAASGWRKVADIVNISSINGRTAKAGRAVYSATKAAVSAYSEALRQECASYNVRVSVIEPGAVDTELMTHVSPEAKPTPGGAVLLPGDVADLVVYIVTRKARVAISQTTIQPCPT